MPDTNPSAVPPRFSVGQPFPRLEDPALLRGEGVYTDDIERPGQLWCAMVRSPYGHGVINAIGTETAAAMPGVVAVFSGADMGDYGTLGCSLPLRNRDGTPMRKVVRPVLAMDKVRFVGDPVAFVVAETRHAARDATEAVELDIMPLDAVTDCAAAAAPGAPQLYDEAPANLVLEHYFGDAEQVAGAFAAAAHVVRVTLTSNRIVVCAMEPRSAIGEWEADAERYVLRLGCQGVFGMRAGIAALMRVPVERVRVLTERVGGSFGMKSSPFPEYACVLHAARVLGRPVKWTNDRSGSFLADAQGRDHEVDAELALDAEGRFLAVRLSSEANLGAYLTPFGPHMAANNFVRNLPSNYRTPLIETVSRAYVTNTAPIAPYRGAGRPEANYFMERLIEAAAQQTGIDRIELRRRNHVQPAELPFRSASESLYDSGDFPAILDQALAAADWLGFPERRAESGRRGMLRGIGIGNYLECTGVPEREMGGIRFDDDGGVTIITGTMDYGQGHRTPFAQILHDQLGIPMERVRLLQGDSEQLIAGGGSGGSRSLMASGSAIIEAAEQVVEKGRLLASHFLEAAAADIEFEAGNFVVAGTDRSISLLKLAEALRAAPRLPENLQNRLDVSHVFGAAPMAYPNGCHVAEVEIDPETGQVSMLRYVAVNDFGVIVNPLMVQGQVHGGIAQGIGQALMESVGYSEEGQLLTGTFMDYAVPRASDMPVIEFHSLPAPATTNRLGVKGCGEAGCAGSLPAVMSAILDALAPLGIRHVDMPARPETIWAVIRRRAGIGRTAPAGRCAAWGPGDHRAVAGAWSHRSA